ncbi:MAG: pyrimidine dimer DNA glycosylase/endonuclease V [Candidatus Pacearchaeota archaeon]
MRIWSLHPKYLDTKGILALWRETLLAKNVLDGKTKGYKNHPQLNRFKTHPNPLVAINFYLGEIYKESLVRGYNFSKDKFTIIEDLEKIPVNKGQIEYEFKHLKSKLMKRDEEKFNQIISEKNVQTHPLFTQVLGEIESWEKTN